jgi:hypothetical protein
MVDSPPVTEAEVALAAMRDDRLADHGCFAEGGRQG